MPVLRAFLITLLIAGISPAFAPAAAQETAAPAVAAPAEAPATADNLKFANKWRLEVHEGANNDGVIHFRLTPQGETPIDIKVQLKDGRGEDGCAKDIRDAFKSALDKNIYKIEIDDGEDVLVKKHKGPDFAIELVESTVKGTRVNLDRE
jgi:hypothetical protein